MRLSVCMILGRCDDKLLDTLHSIDSIADEICLLQTVEDKATSDMVLDYDFGCHLKFEFDYDLMHEDGFLRSFSEARNQSFEMATGDVIMWIDSDDVISDPFRLRSKIDELFTNGYNGQQIDMISMDYDYEFDANGHCTTRHTRERIVRNGFFEWNLNAPIHEILSPVRKSNGYPLDRSFAYIQHNNIQGDDNTSRQERNVAMCKRIVAEGGDQRMKMYYGNALLDVGDYELALKMYQEYLDGSEWDEERYQVMIRIHQIYKGLGQLEAARAWCLKAMETFPQYRPAVLALAELDSMSENWERVVHWMRVYGQCEPIPGMIHNPTGEEIHPLLIMQKAYYELHEWQRALDCNEQLSKLAPENKDQWDAVSAFCRRQLADIKLIGCYEEVLLNTPEEDRQAIYDAIPDRVADYQAFKAYRTKIRPKGKKVVAIYCGYDDTQAWGPESIKKGIGGSEEAVINVSREFVKLGWTVEVYCNCTNEGLIEGVNWYQTTASNPDDNVDLAILWRHPHLVYSAPRGKVTWLWNHDLQDNMEAYYDEDTMNRIDKVMFLGEFHRKTAPWVPDNKVFYTRNGVDPELMLDGENDPNTVIFASSPDRGLDTLLGMWGEIKNANSKARLKVFYGFNKWFDIRYKDNKEKLQWKEDLLAQMESDPTITYYGSVGQDVLAKEIASSGVWAYPTQFGEISCITAMKMQCGGAIPVSTNYAALNETCRFGSQMGEYLEPVFDRDQFIRTMISVVGNKEHQDAIRPAMIKDCREFFPWEKVAKEWNAQYEECLGKQLVTT